MLLNVKILKLLETEVKTQEKFKKSLEDQEKNYGADYTEKKTEIEKSIKFMNEVIVNAKK